MFSIYKKDWTGTPEVLLDPNKLSADGTSRLVQTQVSRDGRYLAYAVSTRRIGLGRSPDSGDRHAAGLDDHLQWIKVSGLAWAGERLLLQPL
jgi:prolyl oligopeptidase